MTVLIRMLDQRLSPPKDLASVFFRAMGLAWPVQLVVVSVGTPAGG